MNNSGALQIQAVKLANQDGLKPWADFFGFGPDIHPQELEKEFSDCFLYEICFDIRVKDRPNSSPSPPHPGVFAKCFPVLLRNMVKNNEVLTLLVKSLDPDYFDELKFIGASLNGDSRKFVMVSGRKRQGASFPVQELPDLLFEWAPDDGVVIVNEWFMSPQVHIEGYVSPASVLAEAVASSHIAAKPKRRRDFVKVLSFAFRLWPDFNGVSIITDKLSYEALHKVLDIGKLNEAIRASFPDN